MDGFGIKLNGFEKQLLANKLLELFSLEKEYCEKFNELDRLTTVNLRTGYSEHKPADDFRLLYSVFSNEIDNYKNRLDSCNQLLDELKEKV